MLENEMWQKCPVSKTFVPDTYSKEFNNFYKPEPNRSAKNKSFFGNFKTIGNPFSKDAKKKIEDKQVIFVVTSDLLMEIELEIVLHFPHHLLTCTSKSSEDQL
jgi:hypothetical protein